MYNFVKYFVRLSFPVLVALIVVSSNLDNFSLFHSEIDNYYYGMLDTILNPVTKRSDYQGTYDENIIIIDTSALYDKKADLTNRQGIAKILSQLQTINPQSIGIDVRFETQTKWDDDLINQIKSFKDKVVLVNSYNKDKKRLNKLADNYQQFFTYSYSSILDQNYRLPSPYFIDRNNYLKHNILPFSFRLFERAFNVKIDSINQFKKIIKKRKTSFYISYLENLACDILKTDNSGKIIGLYKKILFLHHYDMEKIEDIDNQKDVAFIKNCYNETDDYDFAIKKELKSRDFSKLVNLLYNKYKLFKTFVFIGDYYSPDNDKKKTPIGDRVPGVWIHAQVFKMLLYTFNPNTEIGESEENKFFFPFVMGTVGRFVFFFIFVLVLIILFEYFYSNIAASNFRKFYLIQSIISLIVVFLLLMVSAIIYNSVRLRIPFLSSVVIVISIFNLFLFYDQFVSLYLAKILIKIKYGYLPKFLQSSFAYFYAESDLYNKLNILINTFELMLQFLAYIAISDIYNKRKNNSLELNKKNKGPLKDIKNVIRRPTTGIFRYIFMDLYSQVLNDKVFVKVPDQKRDKINKLMSDFISLRNSFFHKSGSFYTYKTKKQKLYEYIKKAEKLFSLISFLKEYKFSIKGVSPSLIHLQSGESVSLAPLVINKQCKLHIKETKVFLYNSGFFDKKITPEKVEYVSNVTDREPANYDSVPDKIEKKVFNSKILKKIKKKEDFNIILENYKYDKKEQIYILQSKDQQIIKRLEEILTNINLISTDINNLILDFQNKLNTISEPID